MELDGCVKFQTPVISRNKSLIISERNNGNVHKDVNLSSETHAGGQENIVQTHLPCKPSIKWFVCEFRYERTEFGSFTDF